MELTPAQKIIARDNHRFRLLRCGRRFGKTTLAVEEIQAKAFSRTDQRIVYLAPTLGQARDLVWEAMKARYQPIILGEPNETRLEIRVRTQDKGISTIYLKGWEAIERLRGWRIDFIVLDEVREMKDWWPNWFNVIRPALTDTQGEGLFMSTPNGFDHFYDLSLIEGKDADFKSFHFTTFDNPFIPRVEIEKARAELPSDAFEQEYMAEFRKKQGLVYKDFNRDIHLCDDLSLKDQVIENFAGIDFGYTNPAAVIFIKKDYLGHYWVMDEWYVKGKTDAEIAEYVSACKFDFVYPDPESPAAIKELSNKSVNVREVLKGKDSVTNGIDKVRNLFKQRRIHINKKCLNLINELETYSYPDKRPDKAEPELPIKEHDHAVDALRYAIMMNDYVTVESDEEFNLYGARYH